MPRPSQVTPNPYPHHFSPVLTPTFSLPALTTFLSCPLCSALLWVRPISVQQTSLYRPEPSTQTLTPAPCSSFLHNLLKVAKLGFGIWSWSVNRLGCKTCFQSRQTVWEPGPRSWLTSATLSGFNGLTVLMRAGTRSRQDTCVPVYNQINSFRDQYSSTA